MSLRTLVIVAVAGGIVAQQTPAAQSPLVERVADTGFIQIEAKSFDTLTPRQQALAYWLTQASIAIDPIVYDQLSQFAVREKRLLEEIMGHTAGIPADTLGKVRQYALQFWANRGNHNENTSQKFLPAFTFDELKSAALRAQTNGAFRSAYADLPPIADADALQRQLDALRGSLFDPNVEPTATAKTTPLPDRTLSRRARTRSTEASRCRT